MVGAPRAQTIALGVGPPKAVAKQNKRTARLGAAGMATLAETADLCTVPVEYGPYLGGNRSAMRGSACHPAAAGPPVPAPGPNEARQSRWGWNAQEDGSCKRPWDCDRWWPESEEEYSGEILDNLGQLPKKGVHELL